MDNYFFEKLSEKNVHDLIPIYFDAFKKKISIDFLLKKLDTSKVTISSLGYIAYCEKNKAVAFYGVYPCQIEFNGKSYSAAQSGDTMTHSDHTGKGLFTQLALKTYESCKENGIHFVFGFPNENSFPGFIKRLGWSHFDDMTPFLVRVKCIPWIRLKNTFKLPQKIHNNWCRYILRKTKKGVSFKSSALELEYPVVDHSEAFFEYKTYSENYLIQLNGINIWVKFDDLFLYIGDIEKCDEETFLKTIKKLKGLAFRMGLPHLRFQTSSDTWGFQMFQKIGVRMETKYPVGGINFSSEIPLEKMKFTGADNDTF
jgi:hypothetical protein